MSESVWAPVTQYRKLDGLQTTIGFSVLDHGASGRIRYLLKAHFLNIFTEASAFVQKPQGFSEIG